MKITSKQKLLHQICAWQIDVIGCIVISGYGFKKDLSFANNLILIGSCRFASNKMSLNLFSHSIEVELHYLKYSESSTGIDNNI